MLQYLSINPETLELLKKLSSYSTMQNFFLVGGTALSLYLGHRMSIDLDFFSSYEFETEPILKQIRKNHKLQIIQQKDKNSIIINIKIHDGSNEYVKVDFLRYNYPIINDIVEIDGVRLLSMEDIIPMKLSAITNRGAKKDFYDIYQLLEHYPLKDMMDYFTKKFPDTDHFQTLKSLTFFDDAEDDFDPISLNGTTWDKVKERLEKVIKDYL